MKLYVDDERKAPDGWVLAKSFEDAMALLATGRVEILSLDHDLGRQDVSGYDILKVMEKAISDGKFTPPSIIKVHSANPPGRDKMESAITKIMEIANAKKNQEVSKKSKKKSKKARSNSNR